jgi:hypothetical protein
VYASYVYGSESAKQIQKYFFLPALLQEHGASTKKNSAQGSFITILMFYKTKTFFCEIFTSR